uniref:Uncharacterized protein n=1 Tax=Oryza nivara TaxID=4536 RepID=A0A0E0FZE1_ORYNI
MQLPSPSSPRRRPRLPIRRVAPLQAAPPGPHRAAPPPSSPSPSARRHSAVLAGRILSPLRSSSCFVLLFTIFCLIIWGVKGELVTVYANNWSKITCGQEEDGEADPKDHPGQEGKEGRRGTPSMSSSETAAMSSPTNSSLTP